MDALPKEIIRMICERCSTLGKTSVILSACSKSLASEKSYFIDAELEGHIKGDATNWYMTEDAAAGVLNEARAWDYAKLYYLDFSPVDGYGCGTSLVLVRASAAGWVSVVDKLLLRKDGTQSRVAIAAAMYAAVHNDRSDVAKVILKRMETPVKFASFRAGREEEDEEEDDDDQEIKISRENDHIKYVLHWVSVQAVMTRDSLSHKAHWDAALDLVRKNQSIPGHDQSKLIRAVIGPAHDIILSYFTGPHLLKIVSELIFRSTRVIDGDVTTSVVPVMVRELKAMKILTPELLVSHGVVLIYASAYGDRVFYDELLPMLGGDRRILWHIAQEMLRWINHEKSISTALFVIADTYDQKEIVLREEQWFISARRAIAMSRKSKTRLGIRELACLGADDSTSTATLVMGLCFTGPLLAATMIMDGSPLSLLLGTVTVSGVIMVQKRIGIPKVLCLDTVSGIGAAALGDIVDEMMSLKYKNFSTKLTSAMFIIFSGIFVGRLVKKSVHRLLVRCTRKTRSCLT